MLDVMTVVILLLSPTVALLALIGNLFVRQWWACGLVGAAVAILCEGMLAWMQETRELGRALEHFMIAATLHSLFWYWVRHKWRARKAARAAS